MKTMNGGPFSAFGSGTVFGDRLAAAMVGRSLAAAYADVVREPMPERLEQLLRQLEQAEERQVPNFDV